MKYKIVYACGHIGTVQLYGKNSDRDRKVKWLESHALCQACQADENREKAQAAIKETANLDLPNLEGSPKQIDWALVIRAKKVQEARIFIDPGVPEEIRERARKFYNWYTGQTQASWWIDHRDESPKATCRLERRTWDKEDKRRDENEHNEGL